MRFLYVRPDFCRRLPSDSTSRWTPLPLAICFPSLGRIRDFHPLEHTHAGRTTMLPAAKCSRQHYLSAWITGCSVPRSGYQAPVMAINFTLSRIFRCTVATRIAISFPIKLNHFCRHHNLHCRQRKGHFVGDDDKKQDNHTDFEHCRQRIRHFVGDNEIAVGTAALRLICVCRLRNYLIIGYWL